MKHINQIKKALKIEGIHSVNSSWSTDGAQIDLVIKRDDHRINLCEMKFSRSEYTIEKKELENLRNKVTLFKKELRTRDAVAIMMITTFGITQNACFHEIVENSFTMDILFEPD